MDTIIANFGRGNYLWPACLTRSTIATMEDEDLRPFWLAGDRAGYVDHCLRYKKTAVGITPTRGVASRWFNIGLIVASTSGDVWLHREKDVLWWTVSQPGAADVQLEPGRSDEIGAVGSYVIHKPASRWSNQSRRGTPLNWNALHARAKEFLFTEGTLQKLSDDNAAYAQALINGEDLSLWHDRPAWTEKQKSARNAPVTFFTAAQRATLRMVAMATQTVANSNGQEVATRVKCKESRFENEQDFQRYVLSLLESQEYLCALSSLPLQLDGEHDDPEMLASLDRIDSNGHYEAGNLQVVCRFVNRWKGADDNDMFLRLIARLQAVSHFPQV